MLDDGRGVTMVEWATVAVVAITVGFVALFCLRSASQAAAWNAWALEMQGDALQLGVALGDIPARKGACS